MFGGNTRAAVFQIMGYCLAQNPFHFPVSKHRLGF
jgi:hypothetical protein